MSWVAVGATVVSAGVGYANSQSQKNAAKKAAKNGQPNIGQDIRDYVGAYGESLPDILGLEGKYRGKFQGINLGEIQSFLQGGKGQMGLLGLSNKTTTRTANQLQRAQKRELRNLKENTGLTRSFLDSLDPQGAAQVRQLGQQATDAQRAATGLTGSEQRSAQQFAREAAGDRGRELDNSAISAEILNRDSILGSKRQEAYQTTNNALAASQAFYQQPGLSQLNRTPQSYQAGQGLLGIGLSSLGSATPQLINPDAGVNIGAANRQNQLGYASAAAQSSAAQNAALYSGLGNAFSSYMQYR